ncbi:alpha/beta fold hydrolase [Sulfitobacter sp. JBTF-M27]|uniref:Alpha/beta fold hydrolase n=1 Tax=Sulfitobacter sediminilitoris TaxID=2698830 RepID=A0A6P0CDF6_9RHOB|nr:alpha/beta fold hydrolase [Sulfitobacter sediminilitoris]NEK23228.1 alpha/beta fold hydrolase [Sulfitobacter sediminilitoris]
MTDEKKMSKNAKDIANSAAENTLALNPLMTLRAEDMFSAGTNMMRAMAAQPQAMMEQWMSFAKDTQSILTQSSDIAPDPKDRRFADTGWTNNPFSKGMMQAYLSWADKVTKTVEELDLPDKDAARARLVSSIVVDAMAPSNNFFINPSAMKTFFETGGKSAVNGVQNLIKDMTENQGLPSSVDTSKFKVGENLAVTPGDVVFRNEVIELVTYKPTTDKVYRRPLLVVPPQINKYYSIDMSPGKSMIEFLLANGIQPYCISWRNPTAENRDWGMSTYIEALDEACDAALEISGADSVNIMGSCSGGITLSTYAGWLAANGKSDKINQVILAVCVLDTMASTDNDMAALVTPETVKAAKLASQSRGVLDGQDMAKMFAWMRPNDLIWNYWVNNYLLGNAPPAFDVLYWNADTTRLPAGLHGDFLDMIFTNPFLADGPSKIGDVEIDMTKVNHPTYVIAGTTDHITPWKAVYETARLYGKDATFILSNSGHLQSLLNPPGNPKAWFMKGTAKAKDPEAWAEKAQKKEGSWWLDWADLLKKQSGNEIKAPKTPGSKKHPSLGAAPGTYVFED